MERAGLRFGGSAAAAALVFAAAARVLLPYSALHLASPEDRVRGWLLTVFCAGVMAVLFGASGALGGRFLGIRDVYFAGSLRRAVETHRRAGAAVRARRWMNAGTWTALAGAFLVGIYFAAWAALR